MSDVKSVTHRCNGEQCAARGHKVNTMVNNMTRSKFMQVWFATIALMVVAGVAFGMTVTTGTGMMLAAMSLVPPAIVLLLWPRVQSRSASDVLHDTNRGG